LSLSRLLKVIVPAPRRRQTTADPDPYLIFNYVYSPNRLLNYLFDERKKKS
jgi:hypothetical protein